MAMPATRFEFRYAFLQAWRLQTTITTAAVLAVMFALVFLPHLRLSVDAKRIRYRVPLFLNDRQGLRSAVEKHAGEHSALFRALPLPPQEASR